MSVDQYSEIVQRLDLNKGIPYTPDWSAAPDFIQLIVDYALTEKPQIIVECSSGLTTLVLARCCQINGAGELYSLENGPEYASKTRSYFDRYGLDDYATVIDAPLEKVEVNGTEYLWYGTGELINGLVDQGINMLVIDGPPGFIQNNSRYPALPILFNKLADGCTLFLDDAARDDEQELVESWLSEYPQSDYQYIDVDRGCAILTINR